MNNPQHLTRVALGLTALLGIVVSSATTAAAQDGTIVGQVTDAATGNALVSAQVQLVGTDIGGLSDSDGNYSFEVPAGTHSVAVVLIGYETNRIDGVSVSAGGSTTLNVQLASRALSLNPVTVTVSRGREERTLAAPAQVSVVSTKTIEETPAITPADYVKGLPGVDVVQSGVQESSVVARGFNGVFNGRLLVLTDNRYARVPSLRLNHYALLGPNQLDVERVEMVLGPAAALYGPNAGEGVMHLITSSPIDRPGTKVSIEGGNRSVLQGSLRHAIRLSDRAGIKFSGRYLTGNEFEFTDPAEIAAQATSDNPLIGQRDFDMENMGGEARLDLRPWGDGEGEVILAAGYSRLSGIVATGVGAAQAKNWTSRYAHLRLKKGNLFAQGFYNKSGAGDTYLLRTGETMVDDSNILAGQLQYGFGLGERIDFITGLDYAYTTPRTGGTIHGQYEDEDTYNEYGGYLHGTFELSPTIDFVGVARVDRHQHLPDAIFTPRAALVWEPEDGQSFRFSFGNGFETPTSTDFFLDLLSGNIPISSSIGYPVRAVGVPKTGFTWNNRCPGGVNDLCMYSPFAAGQQLPASGAALWDAVLVPLALSDPSLQAIVALLGLTPESFAQVVGNPQPGEIGSRLLRLNTENPAVPFFPDPGVRDIAALEPIVTKTYELAYNGILGDRLRVALAGYRSTRERTFGSLSPVTPLVFLDASSVAQFLVNRLVAAGVPQPFAVPIAQEIAATAGAIPLGTVAPDQRTGHDVVVSYPTYGGDALEWYGLDFGFEFIASDQVTLTGSYSHVNRDCFDTDEDGECPGPRDVALNAPRNKLSFGMRWEDRVAGTFLTARMRRVDGFPMDSGVYQGIVDPFTVLDLGVGYRVPGFTGFIVSLAVNNALGDEHREFVGAPEIGRLALLKLQYEF